MESAASGIIAAINAVNRLRDKPSFVLPRFTMIGALIGYVTDNTVKNFQPMGANFGVLPPLDVTIRDKKERYMALSNRSLDYFKEIGEF